MPSVPLYVFILVAMAAGLVVGPLLGPSAAPFGELGKLVIQLIKAVATPLLFLAIVHAVLKTEIGLRAGAKMLVFATINASLALTVGLVLSNAIQPGSHLATAIPASPPEAIASYAAKKIDLVETIASYVPANLLTPFIENQIITLVGVALLSGVALRRVRGEQVREGNQAYRAIEDGVATALRALEVVLGWVVKLIPLAVFGVVTKTVGQYGFAPLKGLGVYVVVALSGLLLHVVLTYQAWLVFWVRMPLREFWRAAREPVVYALGANSSLATLPVTLRALDRLGVSKASSTLGACVGTNFNNDGILLYEAMAVLFVAQAHGIHLDLGQQLLVAVASMVAAMGVAGVPEAGFISLALVMNTVGLPLEILPLLLTVDWVVARCRSAINVLSDMTLSILVDGRRVTPSTGAAVTLPQP
jgi:DAACS family dicarboxylate/amino acid:cation (Na+ or H+) symporter